MGLLGKLPPLLEPPELPVQGPPPGGLAPLQGLQRQVELQGRPQGLPQEPLALRPGRLARHAYPKHAALDLSLPPLLLPALVLP